MTTKTIHVKLLDEGIDVYKPVKAEELGNNLYKIIDDSEKAYEDYLEKWEYKTGDIVECVPKQLAEKNILLAIKKIK